MPLHTTLIHTHPHYPWLVMLHGFGGSIATWNKQKEVFSQRYNICIVELPGHGETQFSLEEMGQTEITDVADLVVKQLHRLGIERAYFLALSLGTLVLAGILQTHPDMVEAVVLCGAVFGMGMFSKLALYLGNVLKYCFPYMAVVGLMSAILMPKHSHSRARKFLLRECRKLGRREFIRWYSLLIHEINRLKQTLSLLKKVPSLIVMGSEDQVFLKPAKIAAKYLGKNSHLEIIPDCGHVCNIQRAEEFNRLAESFFSCIPIRAERRAAQISPSH